MTRTILCIGDSITYGWPDGPLVGFPRLIGAVGLGYPGATTELILSMLEGEMERVRPDMVLLQGGLNDLDMGYAPGHVLENMARGIGMVRERGAEPVVLSLTPVAAAMDPDEAVKQTNDTLREMCGLKGAGFIDVHAPLADPEGWLRKEFRSDMVHPNPEGQRAIASAIRNWLADRE